MTTERDEVKLIGTWAGGLVMRVMIALNLKQVGYKLLQETPGQKSKLLLQSNPVYKKIPVLIHNGKSICESMIIVEYIDETWTSSGWQILPSDPHDRAIARFWTAYIDDKLPGLFPMLMGIIPGNTVTAAERFTACLQPLEEAFEKISKGKSFFNGNEIGYLDIALGSHIGWIKAVEKMANVKIMTKEKTPRLVMWAERFCVHTVKEIMPKIEKLIEYTELIKLSLITATPRN
ncbi:hypothetical protein LUZ60_014658 [Juncus effusus]|nr:hypothetical protein LUZ60_014658 [Juncus effusus]